MIIIETSLFTKRIKPALSDDSYRERQNTLYSMPRNGKIIRGSGGISKVRWVADGQGKRGGVRIIYYWAANVNQIFMLMAYPKNERGNLTQEQLSLLKKIFEGEFNNEQ